MMANGFLFRIAPDRILEKQLQGCCRPLALRYVSLQPDGRPALFGAQPCRRPFSFFLLGRSRSASHHRLASYNCALFACASLLQHPRYISIPFSSSYHKLIMGGSNREGDYSLALLSATPPKSLPLHEDEERLTLVTSRRQGQALEGPEEAEQGPRRGRPGLPREEEGRYVTPLSTASRPMDSRD